MKLDQNLPTRENNLPPEFISELSQLQTSASPPAPWSEIREALGATPEEVFASVEHEPMAAASVAQVHRATLDYGTAVVLKIQRPGVVEEVTRDTDIVLRVCTRLENSAQWARDCG